MITANEQNKLFDFGTELKNCIEGLKTLNQSSYDSITLTWRDHQNRYDNLTDRDDPIYERISHLNNLNNLVEEKICEIEKMFEDYSRTAINYFENATFEELMK